MERFLRQAKGLMVRKRELPLTKLYLTETPTIVIEGLERTRVFQNALHNLRIKKIESDSERHEKLTDCILIGTLLEVKGNKFLERLWSCVCWEYPGIIWYRKECQKLLFELKTLDYLTESVNIYRRLVICPRH